MKPADDKSYFSLLAHPRIPGKTVYFVGSGFSSPLKLPVIRDFVPLGLEILKGKKDSPTWKQHTKLISQITTIANDCRRRLASIQERDPDLEDLFCMADLLPDRIDGIERIDILAEFVRKVCYEAYKNHHKLEIEGRFVPRAHFFSKDSFDKGLNTKADEPTSTGNPPGVCVFQAFLSQVLAEKHLDGDLPAEHKHYARPAIVSLNYDRVIEKKLFTLKGEKVGAAFNGQSIMRDEPEWTDKHSLHLIKLHGSVDWGLCKEYDSCVQMVDDWHTAKAGEPGANASRPMIFPSWQRASLRGTVFEKLLKEARIHLRLASRIVFIGYSLPDTDRYIRYLLADVFDTAEMPQIDIANRWQRGEAEHHVARMMGVRAVGRLKKNYPDGLIGLVKANSDPSSLGSSV